MGPRPLTYLSGPMTGYPSYNYPAFFSAEEKLRSEGYIVLNPASLGEVKGWEFGDYLKRDIMYLLMCHDVCVLRGWRKSRGACLEVRIAEELGMRIFNLETKENEITEGMEYYAQSGSVRNLEAGLSESRNAKQGTGKNHPDFRI